MQIDLLHRRLDVGPPSEAKRKQLVREARRARDALLQVPASASFATRVVLRAGDELRPDHASARRKAR